MKRKVLVIGLDGGSWPIFDLFMDVGIMPNLHRICKEGYRSPLTSTIPAITPTAWTSFATGMNPGKHGIYGFVAPGAATRSYAFPTARRDRVLEKSLWRRLSDYGLESTVLCVPLTYPAEAIKGSLVTGMLTPAMNSKCTYPASLKDELLSHGCMPKFALNMRQGRTGRASNPLRDALKNDGEKFFEELNDITERLRKSVHHLIKKPWDFFVSVFVGTDRIQHALYDQIISIGPKGDSLLAQRIRNFYSKIDTVIGEMIELKGEDTVCILMSDHGFGHCAGNFCMGNWLVKSGYSRYEPKRLRYFVKGLLDVTHTRRFIRRRLSSKQLDQVYSSSYPLDWKRTRAYFVSGDGIRINLKGREDLGIVEPGLEYEDLRKEMRDRLLEIKDPDSGKSVVSHVYFADEIYDGECLKHSPDLIVIPNDELSFNFIRGQLRGSKLIASIPYYTGNHRSDGVFAAYGPGVQTKTENLSNQIIDLAPTIMYQLGLPVPGDMEGKIIMDAFTDTPQPCKVDVDKADLPVEPPSVMPEAGEYTDDEDKILKQRLRDLGYLE